MQKTQNDDRIQAFAPKALVRRAKLCALDLDTNISDVVRRALVQYLDRRDAEAAKEPKKQ
ncbi:hypothetical protein [Paraburkholderia strydomiana]